MKTVGGTENSGNVIGCVDGTTSFPRSYTENSSEEDQLLTIAQSFQKHFSLLYPDRKPLLLCPVNECGLKKLVTTTLRPTMPGLAELYRWEECAQFVSSCLTLEPLDPPTELPRTLRSTQTVLQSQRGSSLEYANVLCSLLLGLNYNAYCVSGYASQHLCELDRSQEICPIQEICPMQEICPVQEGGPVQEQHLLQEPNDMCPPLLAQDEGSHYNVRREGKLHSSFLLKQEELKKQMKSPPHKEHVFAPPPDPLRGQRVHFWVLVRTGSSDMKQDFLIDPLTGNSYPPGHPHFLGVESIWNELNVYVNMQDCAQECQDMMWDPEDPSHWEPLVSGTASRGQLQADILRRLDSMTMGIPLVHDKETGPSYTRDMPLSWCRKINITETDLELCWPGGFKVTHFRQALLENFIPFFRPDGLVMRLTQYADPQNTKVEKVKEWFQNRADFLTERESSGGFTIERFRPGCSTHLLFHRFNTCAPEACPAPIPSQPGVTPEREMRFGPHRGDGLVCRVEQGRHMFESFEKRHDFLFHRHTLFGKCPDPESRDAATNAGLGSMLNSWLEEWPILEVVEKFHRDPSKAAREDIAKLEFLLAERRIEVTYHLEKYHDIGTKRSFEKPSESTSTKKAGTFTADMVSTSQVEPTAQKLTLNQLHQLLLKFMKEENNSIRQIRNSQSMVYSLVQDLIKERENPRLDPCPWTTHGTAQARQHRERMILEEELRWLEEQQEDLLAPVLMRLNRTADLSPDQAQTVYQSCLEDFKSRINMQARLIQERLEEDTRKLEQWQVDFKKMFSIDQREESYPDHNQMCITMSRQIKVSQERLQILKDCAPQKYAALERRLCLDPRLRPHLKDD